MKAPNDLVALAPDDQREAIVIGSVWVTLLKNGLVAEGGLIIANSLEEATAAAETRGLGEIVLGQLPADGVWFNEPDEPVAPKRRRSTPRSTTG